MFQVYNLIFSSGNSRSIPRDLGRGGAGVSPKWIHVHFLSTLIGMHKPPAPSLCAAAKVSPTTELLCIPPALTAFLSTQPQVRSTSVINLCWERSEQILSVHTDIKNKCNTDLFNNVQQSFIIFGIFYQSYYVHYS